MLVEYYHLSDDYPYISHGNYNPKYLNSWEKEYIDNNNFFLSHEDAIIAYSKKILNKNKPMNTILSLIKKIARQEPEKTFVDVGFIDENENITADGKEVLMQILWNKNKAELKELADKLNEATKTNRQI